MKFLLAFTVWIGCAPRAVTTPVTHPANPDAPSGRQAGPPDAFRREVAEPPKKPQPSHEGHH